MVAIASCKNTHEVTNVKAGKNSTITFSNDTSIKVVYLHNGNDSLNASFVISDSLRLVSQRFLDSLNTNAKDSGTCKVIWMKN